MTDAVVSQVIPEALLEGTPSAQVSQTIPEVLYIYSPPAQISQVVIEVLSGLPTQPQIMILN